MIKFNKKVSLEICQKTCINLRYRCEGVKYFSGLGDSSIPVLYKSSEEGLAVQYSAYKYICFK